MKYLFEASLLSPIYECRRANGFDEAKQTSHSTNKNISSEFTLN